MAIRIGTAAWAIPREVREEFASGDSNLARYANRFNATEINSSFYRPHRRETYARWAASVPNGFRFAVKLPKAITHDARLVDCEEALRRFSDEIEGLGEKRGPVLVQLPPKFAFDALLADRFFAQLHKIIGSAAVIEPRHPSWFGPDADALLIGSGIARAAADPSPVAEAGYPGGDPRIAYFRLHGSPRTYWSSYGPEARARWLSRVRAAAAAERWVIFDNTASGAATADALAFKNESGPGGMHATGPAEFTESSP